MKRSGQQRLSIVPVKWRRACAFVEAHHRSHEDPGAGCKFALGVIDEAGELRGVALCGRPVARHFDDGLTLEVNRVATDGCPNACSALYGACWRVACAMGYRRMVTYTEASEAGSSPAGAGLIRVRDLPARGSWADCSVASKHLRDPIGKGGVQRVLWEKTA